MAGPLCSLLAYHSRCVQKYIESLLRVRYICCLLNTCYIITLSRRRDTFFNSFSLENMSTIILLLLPPKDGEANQLYSKFGTDWVERCWLWLFTIVHGDSIGRFVRSTSGLDLHNVYCSCLKLLFKSKLEFKMNKLASCGPKNRNELVTLMSLFKCSTTAYHCYTFT